MSLCEVSVVMLNAIMLDVFMPNVIMLNAIPPVTVSSTICNVNIFTQKL
jgi:hypothetical protein